MSKGIPYFKHDFNASSDFKLKALRSKFGWEGMGWWWYLAEQLRGATNYCLVYASVTFDGLADEYKCDSQKVKEFIDYCLECNLLSKNSDGHFGAPRLFRDMEDLDHKRDLGRMAGIISGEKRADVQRMFNGCSTDAEQMLNYKIYKNKENKENKDIIINSDNSITDINSKESIINNDTTVVISLYQDNVGICSPITLDRLKDITANYPLEWIKDAINVAVLREKRNLSYIEAILRRWKQEGKNSPPVRQTPNSPGQFRKTKYKPLN